MEKNKNQANKKFCPQPVMFSNSFVCCYIQTYCSIFIKSFKQHLHIMQVENIKFEISPIICFGVMLIASTYTHTDYPLKIHFMYFKLFQHFIYFKSDYNSFKKQVQRNFDRTKTTLSSFIYFSFSFNYYDYMSVFSFLYL